MAESAEDVTELPLDGAGTRLRRAREAMGLSLADIAARTRIAERHLVMIETGNFAGMASGAYAIGFSRSYARAVGLSEAEIAQAVRDELARQERSSDRYAPAPFEPGDPARVPSARLAWIAALSALAVVVAGYALWRSFYSPALPLPDLEVPAADPVPSEGGQLPGAEVQQPAAGPVVFTALEQGIWVKIYDSAGNQLMQKQMALGESYAVPADAAGPMIRTARPDALQVSVGGRIVPKLAEQQQTIGDVPISAAALLARVPGVPLATSTAPAVTRPAVQSRPAPQRSPSPLPSASEPPPASPVVPTPQSSTVTQ